jgi:dTDP-glucose 4,6-dehydratase
MIKLLVTGGLGFIFSNFIRKILYERADISIVTIDKVTNPKMLHNLYINKKHNVYIGDVSDPHFVDTVFTIEKPDFVIHGAAESHVDSAITDASPFIRSNVLGTQVVVDACVKHKVNKLIYISSDEVFGHILPEQGDIKWTEESPLNPRNPYSASKAAGELIVKAAHFTHRLNYNITRCCNNFGPRQLPEKLIPKIIKNILENKKVPIYGKGAQLREWIHVDDNCDAILTILEKAPANEAYNISSGYEFSNLEMFQRVCKEMDGDYSLLIFVEDRLGHDYKYASDSSKLRKLGWAPKNKFNDSLRSCIFWYKNNQWFIK